MACMRGACAASLLVRSLLGLGWRSLARQREVVCWCRSALLLVLGTIRSRCSCVVGCSRDCPWLSASMGAVFGAASSGSSGGYKRPWSDIRGFGCSYQRCADLTVCSPAWWCWANIVGGARCGCHHMTPVQSCDQFPAAREPPAIAAFCPISCSLRTLPRRKWLWCWDCASPRPLAVPGSLVERWVDKSRGQVLNSALARSLSEGRSTPQLAQQRRVNAAKVVSSSADPSRRAARALGGGKRRG